jgi:GNAT superfamily N-acetyltransferase
MAEELPARIQRYLRSVVEREREPVPAGAFVLYVHPTNHHPYLNYAIPAPSARADDGLELIRVASERGLVPRLEYLEEAFPSVEGALAASGFVQEGRLRVMTCTPDALTFVDAAVELRRIERGSPLVREMLTVTAAAFGDGPPDDQEVARWDRNTVIAVRDDEVLGSASWTAVIDGISEIAGVGVAEHARRQGIGAALSVAATRCAFEDGASLAILTPGSEESTRVYERAGFRPLTTMLHLRYTS